MGASAKSTHERRRPSLLKEKQDQVTQADRLCKLETESPLGEVVIERAVQESCRAHEWRACSMIAPR